VLITCPDCRERFSLEERPQGGSVACPACGAACPLGDAHRTGTAVTVEFRPDGDEAAADEPGPQPAAAPADRSTIDATHPGRAADTHPGDQPPQDRGAGRGRALPKGVPEIPNYELLGLLGRGGMGLVLEARHRLIDRKVAVKLPLSRRAGKRKRFLQEAHSAARLRHPNICSIHEVGEVDDRPYIVMDLIRGRTLREWANQEEPSARRCAEIVAILGRAVAYAHQQGVIHRDLKPSNVMLDAESGQPVLMDFGLAKEVTLEGSQLTRSGEILGTPAYMSPEQAAGQQEQIGPRSDVYALGAVLYELLCGQPPFSGNMGEVVLKVQSEEPTPLRKLAGPIHRDLETVCLKAMAKDPAERYASAAELAEDLERFHAGEPIKARRRSIAARLCRTVAKRPVLSVLIAAALVAITLSGYLVVQGQRERAIAGLLASLEAEFDAGDWSPDALAKMDATLGQLALVAPQQEATGRTRLAQRFAAAVETELGRATLSPDDIARIQASLDLLAQRDAEKTAALRAALKRRLHSWQPLFELSAPFSQLSSALDPAAVSVAGNALVRKSDHQPAAEPIIATRASSAGAVRMEAVFDASWQQAKQLGVVLGAAQHPAGGRRPKQGAAEGYHFLLHTRRRRMLPDGKSEPIEPKTFAEVRELGGQFMLEVLRGDNQLCVKQISASLLPPGPLRLTAVKEEGDLRFSAGKLAPLEFWDAFAFGGTAAGVFAVVWPEGVGVSQLRASQRTEPEKPSPLQRGDTLFAAGQFADALTAYREQARAIVDAETIQEVRYKEAVCLLALQQETEAETVLEQLAGEPGKRWPILAACQIWLRCVQQNRFDQAHAIFDSLSVRYNVGEIAPLVPSYLRNQIISGHQKEGRFLDVYRPNPNLVRDCRRAVAIARFFKLDGGKLGWGYWAMVRAYRIAGEEQKALEFAEEVLRNARKQYLGSSTCDHVTEYCWLLRLHGRPEDALRELNYWESKGGLKGHPQVALERVRVLAALGRLDEAERKIEALFADLKPEQIGPDYAMACALRGFVRLRRGDPSGAEQAWKDNARAKWDRHASGFQTLNRIMVASLADELSQSQTEKLANRLFSAAGSRTMMSVAQNPLGEFLLSTEVMTSVLRGSFRSPRGRQYAEQIAFREIPFAQCARRPVLLILAEALRQGAMPQEMTEQQEAVLWQLVEEAYAAVVETGRVGKPEFFQLALTWKGMMNFLGWAGVAPRLDPSVRAQVAYVFGHRYLTLKRPADAIVLFRTARHDAPPDSPLSKLAQAELDRLAGDVEPAEPAEPSDK